MKEVDYWVIPNWKQSLLPLLAGQRDWNVSETTEGEENQLEKHRCAAGPLHPATLKFFLLEKLSKWESDWSPRLQVWWARSRLFLFKVNLLKHLLIGGNSRQTGVPLRLRLPWSFESHSRKLLELIGRLFRHQSSRSGVSSHWCLRYQQNHRVAQSARTARHNQKYGDKSILWIGCNRWRFIKTLPPRKGPRVVLRKQPHRSFG